MPPKLTAEEMRREIERLAPFFHNVELPHGLRTFSEDLARRDIERTRIEDLKAYVWPQIVEHFGSFEGLRVLDAACNAGGFSVEAVRSGAAEVIGIDIVDEYLEQAKFIKRALELDNLSFRKQRIETLDPEEIGTFDIVFLLDVLYHFENPVMAIRSVANLSRTMLVIETRLTDPADHEHPTWLMNFLPPSTPDCEDRSTSRWRTSKMCQFTPSDAAVVALMEYMGFSVTQLELSAEDEALRFPNNERLGYFVGIKE